MQKVLLQPLSRGQQATRKTLVGHETGGNTEQTIERNWQGRCDRLAGAIGLGNVERGFELLDKARRMTVAVIGTGRAGSWIAFRLAQSGVGSEGGLILVDTDVTEQGNLDGMLVADRAVGFPKAVAVGGTIAAAISDTHPLCINASISDDKVLDVLKAADVVFTTVDEASVRLGAAVMASRFHLIHIDITGGLAWTMGKKAIAGGELRVFLPGSKGCLGCYDKYNWHEAVKLLGLSGEAERGRRMGLNWHEQRPGSSVDILLPVIGEALQSFWGILRGDVKQGFWYHYEKDHNGRPIWNDWSHKRNSFKCGICNKQGLGDVIN
jgi:molybdopterin/thiamine biosynthesis adenylyltransferase